MLFNTSGKEVKFTSDDTFLILDLKACEKLADEKEISSNKMITSSIIVSFIK